MRIHGLLTAIVLVLMIWLRVSAIEFMFLMLNIALVWITELINTSIEESFNLQQRAPNLHIKIGKDVAAGAVLVAALSALLTGCVIFIPKIMVLF